MWQSFIDVVTKVNDYVNGIVWGWPAIILILGTGLLLSIRTAFLQLRKFGDSLNTTIVPTIKGIGKKKSADKTANSVSQFEAFSAAISGTVGTGNIIGTTYGILAGGPGAVFWMWVSAFFGMVTNYSENLLGLYYRKKDKNGNFSGGAFYYLQNGLPKCLAWLGYVAAVICLVAAVGMSGVQTNKISGTISNALSTPLGLEAGSSALTYIKLGMGVVVAILVAIIIIGGIKRIGKVASMLVPFMSLFFMIIALWAIFSHANQIGGAFGLIFSKAFTFKAAGNGILGYAFATTIKEGMARGVFSNEAGLGSSVIAHSASETREPVKQGLWGVFEVFFDTFVICTLSALMFLTSVDVSTFTGKEDDTAAIMSVFSSNFGVFGTIAFSVILPLFAFTTIMAWSYYGEKACEFCFQKSSDKGRKVAVMVFKILYVLFIILSAIIDGKLIWALDDTANGLMALPNLIGLIIMSGTIVKVTNNYYQRKKGAKIEPMLSAYPDLNEAFKKDIEEGGSHMQ